MAQLELPEGVADPASHAFSLIPEMGQAALAFSTAAYQYCRLTLRELEGARFMTALLNGCVVCQEFRAKRDLESQVRRAGGTGPIHALDGGDAPDEAFYDAVPHYRTASGLTERERLMIELAERMGQAPLELQGDTAFWSRIHDAFEDRELVSATFAIAAWMGLGRAFHTLEIDNICLPTFDRHAA